MTQPSGEPDLRSRRLEHGLTMQQLAERCRAAGVAVSVSEISRIERRIHTPRPALRKKLAELLGLAVTDIGARGIGVPVRTWTDTSSRSIRPRRG